MAFKCFCCGFYGFKLAVNIFNTVMYTWTGMFIATVCVRFCLQDMYWAVSTMLGWYNNFGVPHFCPSSTCNTTNPVLSIPPLTGNCVNQQVYQTLKFWHTVSVFVSHLGIVVHCTAEFQVFRQEHDEDSAPHAVPGL